MKKFVCGVCGYVYEGEALPADYVCPVCKATADKFQEQASDLSWAAEHVVGIAKGVDRKSTLCASCPDLRRRN